MEIKVLELRDKGTFIPVICIRPLPDNEEQHYLLQRDGYSCSASDNIVIMIDAQCRGVSYDPYDWPGGTRTKHVAHAHIRSNWNRLRDGDVVDVEFILGESSAPKQSKRVTHPL
jgi:hypothetical protein